MTDTATRLADLGLASTSSPVPADVKVVTATITSANADVASLSVQGGYDAIMPVTEFYANRRWAVGQTYQLLQLGDGPRPILSAVRPEFVEALLMGVCPEARDGRIRVMGVARVPGVRSKLAVAATEPGVDAVAACVGRGANRVRGYLSPLMNGERVDVVAWHDDKSVYLRNALAPAQVSEVVIEGNKATAIAPHHMMSAAIGGDGGLNSALAGKLTGLHVVIVEG